MIETNGVLTGEHLREMIRQYASQPDRFFPNGQVNESWIETLIAKNIEVNPRVCFGSACIRGTRATVEDIVALTCDLKTPKAYVLKEAFGLPLPPEAIDTAYAFFMKYPGKVATDYNNSSGKPLPQEIYS